MARQPRRGAAKPTRRRPSDDHQGRTHRTLHQENAAKLKELFDKVTIDSVGGIGSLNVEVTPQGLVQFHAFCLPKLDQAGCDTPRRVPPRRPLGGMTNRPAAVVRSRDVHRIRSGDEGSSRPGFVDREFASYSDRVLAKFKEALR